MNSMNSKMAAKTNQVKALPVCSLVYDVPDYLVIFPTITALGYLKEQGYGLTSWNITLKFVFVLIG